MKYRTLFFSLAAGIAVMTALLFAACSSPVVPPTNDQQTGSLLVSLTEDINTRMLAPPIDMMAASYKVTGVGPGGAAFSGTTTGASMTMAGLVVGDWTIMVNASNTAADIIGSGTASAAVMTGVTTEVMVNVIPISGTGSLTLMASWPEADVPLPTITASLTPMGTQQSSPQSLDFVISGATASYTSTSVPNGYYALAFTLFSNGVEVTGAADTVRIVTGQTTSGIFSFTNVNNPGGSLIVTITTNLQNPLLVELSGGEATQNYGDIQTFTASVSNYSDLVVYDWFVNGAKQTTTGSSFSFGSGVAVGFYRIDVIAYTADGTQAGSATQAVQVQSVGPALVNLATAGNYVILAKSAITTSAETTITGDIGASPITADSITGFGLVLDSGGTYSTSDLVIGKVYASDYAQPTHDTLATAVTDMHDAYTDAAARPTPDYLNLGAGSIGGITLLPGVYKWESALSITSAITISGSPTDVWIFQVSGTFNVGSGISVALAGGALPQNIFWQVAGAVTLDTDSQMNGIILAGTAITMNTGATIIGRLLAMTAVTLYGNTVSQP
jgi:hypothetical protein